MVRVCSGPPPEPSVPQTQYLLSNGLLHVWLCLCVFGCIPCLQTSWMPSLRAGCCPFMVRGHALPPSPPRCPCNRAADAQRLPLLLAPPPPSSSALPYQWLHVLRRGSTHVLYPLSPGSDVPLHALGGRAWALPSAAVTNRPFVSTGAPFSSDVTWLQAWGQQDRSAHVVRVDPGGGGGGGGGGAGGEGRGRANYVFATFSNQVEPSGVRGRVADLCR